MMETSDYSILPNQELFAMKYDANSGEFELFTQPVFLLF